jgi:hypothetical protein
MLTLHEFIIKGFDTNNGKKASALLQTTGGKDEPNIVSNVEIVTEIKTRKLERKDT